MNSDEEENEVEKVNNKNTVLVFLLGMLIGAGLGVFLSVTVLNKQSERMSTDIAVEQQEFEGNVFEDDVVEELGVVADTPDEEGLVIETPVVNLNYPEKWENQIRIEQIDGEPYIVRFFATLERKDEKHIFDIIFGKTEGILLGTLNETDVYLNYAEVVFDESWSDEDADTIYAMQEDVNGIIEMLQEEEGFVPAF